LVEDTHRHYETRDLMVGDVGDFVRRFHSRQSLLPWPPLADHLYNLQMVQASAMLDGLGPLRRERRSGRLGLNGLRHSSKRPILTRLSSRDCGRSSSTVMDLLRQH
jgi:hypothetical protein